MTLTRLTGLVLAGFCLVANISCTASSKDGGAPAIPPGNKAVESAKTCSNRFNVSPLFGKFCAAGSNLPLCAMDSTSNAEICLFDYTHAQMDTYYTATCSAQAGVGCTRGFSCKQEQCGHKDVCVKTGPPVDRYDGFLVGAEPLPPRRGNFVVRDSAVNSKGDRVVMTSGSEMLLRKASGQWSALELATPILAQMYPRHMVMIDDAFYLFNSVAFNTTTVQDSRSVYRIDGEQVTLVEMPGDLTGQVCHGLKERGCYGEISMIWKDSDGLLTVIAPGPQGFYEYKKVGTAWVRQTVVSSELDRAAAGVTQVEGGYTSNQSTANGPALWMSSDLIHWTAIPFPAEATTKTYTRTFSFALNDIWLIDDNGLVFHWTGSSWGRVAGVGNATNHISSIGGGRYVTSGGTISQILQGDCWRDVPAMQDLIFGAGNQGAYLTDKAAILFDPNFVADY